MGKGTVNKVILIGRLGADPELKFTPSGVAVASFRMATNEVWRDAEGNQQERTDWHNIVAWRRLGEICGEMLKKGGLVYIEGKLRTRSWEDQNGMRRYTTEVVADQMQMLGGRSAETPPAAEEAPAPPTEASEDDLPF